MNAKARPRILVVDDDAALAEAIADGLAARGYDARAIAVSEDAVRAVDAGHYDALVTDLRMPTVDGVELLDRSQRAAPRAPVLVMTAFSGVESAITCIRRGAYHYLTKPFRTEELALFLEKALEESRLREERTTLRRALRAVASLDGLVGNTQAMRHVTELVRRVSDANVPVLILGETGTGKGLIARAIHAESGRESAPFVTVNCAALPEQLLESELFGHARGAFTGATTARRGLFAAADGGTLFLDEIGDLALPLQAKLLRVLETGMVRAVGESRERAVDVRIVAATHKDLRAAVREQSFREDLFYRLDVVSIVLPPLRERREDVPFLVEHFLHQLREKHPKSVVERFDAQAHDALLRYPWPGNVRELAHVVERVVLLGASASATRDDLPAPITDSTLQTSMDFGGEVLPLRELQRRYARWALSQVGGAKKAACEALGIDYKTLMRHLGDPA
jgi:two-component system response regulator HydG